MGTKGLARNLDASELRVGILVSRYNEDISQRLLDGALRTLIEHGAASDHLSVHWVPGAFELPLAAKVLGPAEGWDAVVCLGCVIKGETPHFEYVAGSAAAGLGQVALETGIPCAFGVLTTLDRDQALARVQEGNNKGSEAAETAI